MSRYDFLSIESIHDDIVSNVRENLHYLDVSIFNHILSGRYFLWKRLKLCSTVVVR